MIALAVLGHHIDGFYVAMGGTALIIVLIVLLKGYETRHDTSDQRS